MAPPWLSFPGQNMLYYVQYLLTVAALGTERLELTWHLSKR